MKRKQFALSIAAAAMFAAFGPVNAQTISASPNVGVDANVGIGSRTSRRPRSPPA